MKIWIKYLIGILAGMMLTLVAPQQSNLFNDITHFITSLVLNFGRYALYPVLFFSFSLAVFELRDSRSLLKLAISTTIVIIGSTVTLSLIGLLSVLIHTPSRIPIFVEGASQIDTIGVMVSLSQLFPSSAFEVFTNGSFILPLCIFAGFAGAGCAVDKVEAKATLTLFDSLSRVSYSVLTFFVDAFAIGMIAVSFHWSIQFKTMLTSKVFLDFILLLLTNLLIVALVVYPAIIRLACGKINPYRVLYASIGPILAAFFTGDTLLLLAVNLRHTNESLGVRRKISSISVPLFSIFARGGSALVVIVSFIVILKSYSSLGIAFGDMIYLMGTAILLSFLLGRFPVGGTYIALATVCMLYGRGFESGYLILKPVAFFLGSIAAALDALSAITGTFIIAKRQEMVSHRDLRFYI